MSRILYLDNDREAGNYFEVQIWQVLEFLKNNGKNLCRIFILFLVCFSSLRRVQAGSTACTAQSDLEGLVTAKKAVVWIWVIFLNGSNSKEKKFITYINMPNPTFLISVCMLSHAAVSDSLWPHGLCGSPGSSVGIFQARILEWFAIPFSSIPFW